MANLSLKHIYKIYDNGTKAVDDFNLEIGDNEFIVFVGPSGCGKSTTLRMIAGLEDITAGDFYIDGILSNSLEPKDRDMAMVFQNYALYPHMTVYDNMAFGLKIRHVPKDEIDRRVHEASRILDIENQLNKKPKAMSGGQRQRVALGRAIVRKPKVFLLDEPLSNLDAKLRSSMRSEITRLHHVLGTTFIYVTHDQIEAMTMGTKIVVMKLGVIQQVDSPMNLYDYPVNEFVAGFIGTPQMNFFDAKMDYEGKDVSITSSFNKIVCSVDDISRIDIINIINKKPVVVGIRPEHVVLCKPNDKNAFECEISVIEALGNECNLIVESVVDKTRITIRTLRNDNFTLGQKIYVKLDLSKMHLFLKESTNTILPRIPQTMTVRATLNKDKLSILGHKLSIPSFILDKLNGVNYYVSINNDSIIKGTDFKIKIVNKEKINNRWVFKLKHKDEYLFYSQEQYIDGDYFEFSLSIPSLKIFDENGQLVIDCLNKYNEIDGKLVPHKMVLPVLDKNLVEPEMYERLSSNNFKDSSGKKIKIKNSNIKVFNYLLLGKEITPNNSSIVKIYNLLGKKFELHQIKFSINSHDIKISEDGLFAGEIKNIIDYGNETYYIVNVNNEDILIFEPNEKRNVSDQIHFNIDNNVIGVTDINFKVRLI